MAHPHGSFDTIRDSHSGTQYSDVSPGVGRGTAEPGGVPLSRFQRFLCTLGGAQADLLARARVELAEMRARGIAALIPALFGAVAGTVTLDDAYRAPLAVALAVGLAWGAILLLFDLSLMAAAPGRSLASQLVVLGSRAIVSILAAFAIAGSIVLALYGIDIGVQLRADQQSGLASYKARYITPRYQPVIAADQRDAAADEAKITAADAAVTASEAEVRTAHLDLVCERNGITEEVGCGRGTGRFGEGPAYQVRLAEYDNATATLASAQAAARGVKDEYQPQIAALLSAARTQQQQEQSAYALATSRYLADDGLIARWRALGQLEHADPGVHLEVLLFQALIIAIDLSAVLAKVSSRTPAYDRIVQAQRKRVMLQASQAEEAALAAAELARTELAADAAIHAAGQDARVEVSRAWSRAEAHVAVRQTEEWVRQQTGETGEASYRAGSSSFETAGATGHANGRWTWSDRVYAPNLSGFAADAMEQEQQPLALARPLAWAAWLGLGLLCGVTVAMVLLRVLHATTGGLAIAALALAAGAALAVYSRGFRHGPSWVHHAAFGVAVLGLVMPAVITALNV